MLVSRNESEENENRGRSKGIPAASRLRNFSDGSWPPAVFVGAIVVVYRCV